MSTEAATNRSARPVTGAWLAGVCAGLADQLGWRVMWIRVLFVLLVAPGLLGIVLYLALWLVMPQQTGRREQPGLAAGARAGLRPQAGPELTPVDLWSASALALLGLGLIWLMQLAGFGPALWLLQASLLTAAGFALIWRQADRGMRTVGGHRSGWRLLAAVIAAQWLAISQITLGMVFIVGAIWIVLDAHPYWTGTVATVIGAGLGLAGLLLAALPWWLGSRRALAQARQDALLADARADMAAHLHDSVLQTLALIQRKAHDPKAVMSLARRQERELRNWLYAESADTGSFVEALAEEIADVEDRHGVDIELVSVGDTELTAALVALLAATREAMVNAAKHANVTRVDVYTEVDSELVAVFVRDRGVGFDLGTAEAGRMGVRGSIIERINRVGGRAIIRTEPGAGTEVRLELPR